jgi:hypothetical protein
VKLITLIFVAFGGLFLVSCSGPPTLYPIFEKGKFGYADVSGRVVITPAYEQCGEFNEGLAVVMKEGLVGFIDTNGKVVIDFQYPNAGRFSEGLAHASKDGKTGFIDKTGKVVIPFEFDYAFDFSEGLASIAASNAALPGMQPPHQPACLPGMQQKCAAALPPRHWRATAPQAPLPPHTPAGTLSSAAQTCWPGK